MSRKQIIVLVFSFGITLSPYIALGTTGSVTIDFGGLCNSITIAEGSAHPHLIPPPPFFLFDAGGSFTCASGGTNYFKIEDNGANRAQILPSSSGASSDTDISTNDTLRVKDWKITALTATPANLLQGYEVSVRLQFDNPPVTDGPGGSQDIYYKTTSYGNITKTTGNWIKMDPGYVTNPLGSAETTLGIPKTYNATCAASPCSFGLSTSGKWPDNPNILNGARILRTKFAFRLNAANNVLLINSTGGKINSQTNADIDDSDECSEQYMRCPSVWATIFSTFKWTKMSFSKGEASETAKLDTFTKVNWASLQQDVARGNGEYLASLATLLEVPIEKQKDFFIFAQDQYRTQAEEGVVTRVELLSRLQEAIAGRPMLFAGTMDPTP